MRLRHDPSQIPPAPDFSFEKPLWDQGITRVAGIDEAGRGALAGPVAAAAVIFPAYADPARLFGVRDSKQMTPAQRCTWAERLLVLVVTSAVGYASAAEIDQLGIVPATRLAVKRAIQGLHSAPEHLLVDYLPLPGITQPQTQLVKGDARSLSIAAASILAKTARDAKLRALDQCYPGYFLAEHKGYGTAAHRAALSQLGYSPEHRRTFRLKGIIE